MTKPIAIVGIGCLFPKAPDLTSYWQNIMAARECLSEVPDGHSWSVDDYFDPDRTKKDKVYATRGGFLDRTPFDPIAWGVPPNQLESIDTSQLLSLLVARACLQDAGIDPDAQGWDRDHTSVIIGCTGTQEMAVTAGARLQGPIWRRAMQRAGLDEALVDTIVEDIGNHFPTWTEQTFPGLLGNVIAGRITNRFDLGGTNAVVDAACASSLAAIQYAMGDLQAGRSNLVLSGGVDTLNDIFMFECFTRTPAMSPSNQARPFDNDSDGILIGEGIAMVAMKRLEDAERDGDRVYAVIKGLGSSSDGRGKSIYAPNSTGQAKAIRRAHEQAGVDADTVELIEAHGTGTKAGDAAELGGLLEVFGDTERDGQFIAVGSVKSQVGHTKSTAGAAGLVKAALALHQRVLPPTAKVETPSKRFDWEGSPFYVNSLARPWVRSGSHPRRAGVSAFGFGGSNFHALLEEYGDSDVPAVGRADAELFLISGYQAGEVKEKLEALIVELEHAPTLAHAARSTLEQWRIDEHVVSFVAASLAEARKRVDAALALLEGKEPGERGGVRYAQVDYQPPRMALLFPGQGSQYVNMGRTLALRHAALRQTLDRAETTFESAERGSLAGKIYPIPAFDDATRKEQLAELTATEWAQPAIGAVSAGMFHSLARFGVSVEAVAGHSYGELVALHAAGVFDEESLFLLSLIRGEAMANDGKDRGTMAAVSGELSEIQATLDELDTDVVLANRNHPTQGVISGTRAGIDAALEALSAKGMKGKVIQVSAAFHSELVADAREPFAAALQDVEVSAPRTRVYSNKTGQPYPDDPDAIRELLADQIVNPVKFVDIVQGLYDGGVRIFVECGPKGVLTGLARKTLADHDDVVFVALDGKQDRVDGDAQLKRVLATLAGNGVAVDVAPLLEQPLPNVPLPGSPATVHLGGANWKNATTLEPPLPDYPEVERPAPAAPQAAQAPRTATPEPQQRSAPAVHLEDGQLRTLLDATRQTLVSFQASQERTAKIHSEFLKTHAQATESFTRLFDTHARLVGMATGDVNLSELPARSVPSMPESAPLSAQTPPAEASGFSGYMNPDAGVNDGTIDLPTGGRARVATDLPPLFDAQQIVSGAANAKASKRAAPAPVTAGPDITEAMLVAVAEKTGYPREMLELGMDMESDLGIDSIKRVEILAAVQDAVPGLPELDNDEMSAMRTLQEVVDALQASPAASASTPAAPTRQVSAGPDVTGAMLTAVAEKTGYPREMLELGMDMESDLGIDSIKRVEILAAVQDAVPGLPELDNDEMSAMRTLQEIVDALQAAAPAGPTTTPTAPASGPSADVTGAMLTAVAEKTGYPREMLELGMDMESDLGIDSIKRVEILAAVQDAVPALPELDNDEMSAMRTLQEVVDLLQRSLGGPQSPKTPAPTPELSANHAPQAPKAAPEPELDVLVPEADQEESPIWEASAPPRRVPRVVRAPEGKKAAKITGTVVITKDKAGLAEAIADALSERDVANLVIDPSWRTEKNIRDLLPRDLGAVVHVAAVGTAGSELEQRVRGGFLLAKATGPQQLFATVTRQDGCFGFEHTARPIAGALAGLSKTLAHEWSETRCLAIDVHPDAKAEWVADELIRDRGVVEIGVRPDQVISIVHDEVDLPEVQARPPVDPGDLILVSGGARGVTAAVAEEMAERWSPSFLLLGRSPVPADDPSWATDRPDPELKGAYLEHAKASGVKVSPKDLDKVVNKVLRGREIRRTLSAIRGAGCKVVYAPVDVRDTKAVSKVVKDVCADLGPVRGVVHGAGVIADKLLMDKTQAQFDTVWSTKVDGMHALVTAADANSDGDELKLLAVFSSVAGRYGNAGQCDYSMANEAITRYARAWSLKGTRAVAFDWGPWAGGMVTPSLKAKFEKEGIYLIPVPAGARFFCDELERGDALEVVVGGPSVNDPTIATEGVVKTITGDLPFLKDHVIKGRPVLPAAMALEWMAEAARTAYPSLHFAGVRDFRVRKGVTVPKRGRSFRITWKEMERSPGYLGLSVYLESTDRNPIIHYSAMVELTRDAPQTNKFPGSNGLSKHEWPYELESSYEDFLFHGPSLRGIEEILGYSDHGIVARLQTSRPNTLGAEGDAWSATDPLTVDSALQLMLLWVREKHHAGVLPMYLGAYRQYRPFDGAITAHVSFDRDDARKGLFDVAFVDEDGTVVAEMAAGEYVAAPS